MEFGHGIWDIETGVVWDKVHSPPIGEEFIFKSIYSDSIDISISKQKTHNQCEKQLAIDSM